MERRRAEGGRREMGHGGPAEGGFSSRNGKPQGRQVSRSRKNYPSRGSIRDGLSGVGE